MHFFLFRKQIVMQCFHILAVIIIIILHHIYIALSPVLKDALHTYQNRETKTEVLIQVYIKWGEGVW